MFENRQDNRPIYTQLVERLSLDILAGAYQPGQKLPSVRELSMDMAVNPNTLQRALGELEQRELIQTVSTSGKFITRDSQRLESLRREMARGQIRLCRDRLEQLGYGRTEISEMMKEDSDDADSAM